MTSPIALFFPGQGAQHTGMLADLADTYPIVKHTFEEASDSINLDLWALSQGESEHDLNLTCNTQPALLTASTAIHRIIMQERPELNVQLAAGHSLGEYSALVAAGALPFAQAVQLVRERGTLMEQAVPNGQGGMAAILGLDDDAVLELCANASAQGVVEAVNFNAPAQVVIAGEQAALAKAIELAKDKGAKRALPLQVSGPFHSSLMKEASSGFEAALNRIDWSAPAFNIIHNATLQHAAASQLPGVLLKQLYSPVNWVKTVACAVDQMHVDAPLAIEVGPAKVLAGLNKRIDRSLITHTTGSLSDLHKTLDALA